MLERKIFLLESIIKFRIIKGTKPDVVYGKYLKDLRINLDSPSLEYKNVETSKLSSDENTKFIKFIQNLLSENFANDMPQGLKLFLKIIQVECYWKSRQRVLGVLNRIEDDVNNVNAFKTDINKAKAIAKTYYNDVLDSENVKNDAKLTSQYKKMLELIDDDKKLEEERIKILRELGIEEVVSKTSDIGPSTNKSWYEYYPYFSVLNSLYSLPIITAWSFKYLTSNYSVDDIWPLPSIFNLETSQYICAAGYSFLALTGFNMLISTLNGKSRRDSISIEAIKDSLYGSTLIHAGVAVLFSPYIKPQLQIIGALAIATQFIMIGCNYLYSKPEAQK